MHPSIKILIGAILIAVGIFSTITFNQELLTIAQGALGPILVVIGAFIVWLESDEWKLRRQEKREKKEKKKLDIQKSLSDAEKQKKREKKEAQTETARYINALEGTVKEAQKNIREMDEPNLEKILELEKRGKDRKTIKEFLERRMD